MGILTRHTTHREIQSSLTALISWISRCIASGATSALRRRRRSLLHQHSPQHFLWRRTYGRDQIAAAAEMAQVKDDIEAFPDGFDTVVGERGVTLSGGQRQRVCIARALIRNPAILLLDDCLSAVDTQTEARILAQLREYMKGRTCVISSHRISAVKHADHIIVLDDGKLVEQGTHESLLAAGGLYADMYERQLLEEELESRA